MNISLQWYDEKGCPGLVAEEDIILSSFQLPEFYVSSQIEAADQRQENSENFGSRAERSPALKSDTPGSSLTSAIYTV